MAGEGVSGVLLGRGLALGVDVFGISPIFLKS